METAGLERVNRGLGMRGGVERGYDGLVTHLSLLLGLLRFFASHGLFPGWRLHRKPRDHRLVVTQGHALLVSFRRTYSPNAHLLLQEQTTLDHEHLLDDRNDHDIALVSNSRHRLDVSPYRGA